MVLLCLLAAACHSRNSGPRAPVLGVAYVGPPTLNLRAEIALTSAVVTTVNHGDRVEIVHQHNNFFKVRAPGGAEGWTDQRQLLGAQDMATVKALAGRATGMPSQMRASVDADLRVHIMPASTSPGFLMLKANDKVDVLTRIRRPRTDLPRKPLITPAPKKAKATRPPRAGQVPPPPMPKAPPLPSNWLDLSKTEEADEEPADQPPQPTDEWSLIRTPDGQTGWVLTRRLTPAIPDEVYQYAEGHLVVSYFSLGSVQDGDQKKDTWLWTTVAAGSHAYDFDSFRVFGWSIRHHRYETEYVQRNLTGYLPVLLQPVRYSDRKDREGDEYPGFSVCIQKKDGELVRERFAAIGNVVRFVGDEPCQLPPPVDFTALASTPAAAAAPAAKASAESLAARVKRRVKALFGHK